MDPLSPLALERATLRMWRTRVQEERFGWTLQAETGAEAWCRRRSIRPTFKLADGAVYPQDLVEALARRGYQCGAPTLTMTSPVSAALEPADGVELAGSPQDAFHAALAQAEANPADAAERRSILARAPGPGAYAAASVEGAPAAIGCRLLAPPGLAGIFAMRTAPAARRRDLARRVLSTLCRRGPMPMAPGGCSCRWRRSTAQPSPSTAPKALGRITRIATGARA